MEFCGLNAYESNDHTIITEKKWYLPVCDSHSIALTFSRENLFLFLSHHEVKYNAI